MRTARARYRIKGTKIYIRAEQDANPVFRPRLTPGYDSASLASRVARWRPTHGGPNAVAGAALPLVRARSRDAVRKDPLANAIVDILVTNVISTGIKPQFQSPDAGFNKALAELFLRWTDETDADDAIDYYGQQALAFRSALEGGEVFARFRPRLPSDGLAVPLQIQLFEGEYCPVEKTLLADTAGHWIQNGVEFDAIGVRCAYWMYRQHPYDAGPAPLEIFDPLPVPASEIMHVRILTRPGLIRGVPWLARVLVKLKDLDEYDDAQLVRQKLAALFAGFVTETGNLQGLDGDPIFEGETATTEDGVALAPLEPGTMQVMPVGKDIKFSAPPTPGDNYDVFIREQVRRTATGGGVLYEELSGDFAAVNDRTWRAAASGFRRRCERMQYDFVYQYCRPIVQRWLRIVELGGILKFPAGITADSISVEHLAPQWPYINPVQDIEATNFEIRAGLTSRAKEVSKRGLDVEQIDAENKADNERQDKMGLVYDSDSRLMSRQGSSLKAPSQITSAAAVA
jgi:lambda family phage portal protein